MRKLKKKSNDELQRPGYNCITDKPSMRKMLIPVGCKRWFGGACPKRARFVLLWWCFS
jgi:hypothetical protein